MKKILLIFSILILVAGFHYQKSLAQTSSSTTESYLVATVNVFNATSTQIAKDTYNISFQLKNRVGIQSGIRYGVELVNTKTRDSADTYLANTSLTLGPDGSKDITIKYTVPDYIPAGDYTLYIVSENSNRVTLARLPLKNLDIEVTKSTSVPTLSNCYLTVTHDSVSSSAKPGSEVGLLATDTLQGTCQVSTPSNTQLQLITHAGDRFGEIVSQEVVNKKITKQDKSITFDIPTPNNSGMYTAEIFFTDSQNQKISASTYLRYDFNPLNFNLENVILDKTDYQAGESANLKMSWNDLGSNNGSTYIFQTTITDKNGLTCGQATKDITSSTNGLHQTELDIPITETCSGAIANTVVSRDGETLAKETLNSNLNSQDINLNPAINSSSKEILAINKLYVVLFIIILALIGYGIILFRKGHEKNNLTKK